MPDDFGTTAGAGNVDPTAGALPNGGAVAGQGAGGPSDTQAHGGQITATQPDERRFTQADLDKYLQERLSRANRQFEARFAELQRQYDTLTRRSQGNYDADAGIQPDDPVSAQLREHAEVIEELKLDREIAECRAKHPDFDEPAVFRVMHDTGLPTVESAYRHWKYDSLANIDLEAERKKAREEAIKEYLKQKGETAAQTPPVEGKGGGAPSGAPAQKPKNKRQFWDNVAKESIELMANSRRG